VEVGAFAFTAVEMDVDDDKGDSQPSAEIAHQQAHAAFQAATQDPAVIEAEERLARLDKLCIQLLSHQGSIVSLSKIRETGLTSDVDAAVEGAQINAAALGLINAAEGLFDLIKTLKLEAVLYQARGTPKTEK
jgi:Surfeit locus protein 5 subunit 22 of Mediator complex